MKTIAWTTFLYFFPFCLFAQNAQFQFFTTEDGLSSNRCISVAKDQQGFIWVASDVLNRFDGYNFLNKNNSLHPVFNTPIITGNIVSKGEYLYYYNDHHLVCIHTLSGEKEIISFDNFIPNTEKARSGVCLKLPNEEIIAIVLDAELEETYFFRIKNRRVVKFNTVKDIHAGYSAFFMEICGDEKGNLYYPDKELSAILKVNPEGEIVQRIPQEFEEDWIHLAAGLNNSVFLVLDDRLYVLNEGDSTFKPHPASPKLSGENISDVKETEEGNLWICSYKRHLIYYDSETGMAHDYWKELEAVMPHQVNLDEIYFGDDDHLWVTTVLGLLKVTPNRVLFESLYGLPTDVCEGPCSFRGFTEGENGDIYTAFYRNLCQITSSGQAFPIPISPSNLTPFDLLYDERGIIWSDGRLIDPQSGKISNPFGSRKDNFDTGRLERDGLGRIWWAWGRQLFLLDARLAHPKWEEVDLVTDRHHFYDVKYDPYQNLVWLIHGTKLLAYQDESKQPQVFDFSQKWPGLLMHFIHPDGKGGLWLGSRIGLLHFNPQNETWKKYAQADGLPNDNVVCILPEGDSCLWLSTDNGLSRFSIAAERFINFFEEDGLTGNEFNRRSSHLANNGRMYFGGIKGITTFFPKDVMGKYVRERAEKRLQFLSVSMTKEGSDTIINRVFHKDQPSLDIYFENKTVTLEFGLLDFNKTGKNLYSYLIDGHDQAWSKPSANNMVTFSSLPSGEYMFRVKVLDSNGEWLPEELAVALNVHPPWWATWWAYGIYFILLASLTWGVYFFLKRRWALKNQLANEQQEAQRLKELDSVKSRLYTNLTHEFRTPLTVILGMTDQMAEGTWQSAVSSKDRKRLEQGLSLINRNGQHLLGLVNQLLDLSKLEDKSFRLDWVN